MGSRCLVVSAVLGMTFGTTLHAQRSVRGQVSVGTVAFLDGHVSQWLGGWYVDAMQSFGPDTAVVAEASGAYGPEREPLGSQRWFAALGGIRQRVVRQPGANVSLQMLAGPASWSQRFRTSRGVHSVSLLAFQPGLVVDIPVNQRWSVRARADSRLAFSLDAESAMGGSSLAFGVNRYWGRR